AIFTRAPVTGRLPLLPSGPGGVHGVALRGVRPPRGESHDTMPLMEHPQTKLAGYAQGRWHDDGHAFTELPSAIDGHTVALAPTDGLDFGGMVRYARTVA